MFHVFGVVEESRTSYLNYRVIEGTRIVAEYLEFGVVHS